MGALKRPCSLVGHIQNRILRDSGLRLVASMGGLWRGFTVLHGECGLGMVVTGVLLSGLEGDELWLDHREKKNLPSKETWHV